MAGEGHTKFELTPALFAAASFEAMGLGAGILASSFFPPLSWGPFLYSAAILAGGGTLFGLIGILRASGDAVAVRRSLIGVFASVGLAGVVVGSVLFVNAHFDREPAEERVVPVSSKFERTGKNRGLYYQAELDGKAHQFRASLEDFHRIQPGVSRVRFRVKKGFLGAPWLEAHSLD